MITKPELDRVLSRVKIGPPLDAVLTWTSSGNTIILALRVRHRDAYPPHEMITQTFEMAYLCRFDRYSTTMSAEKFALWLVRRLVREYMEHEADEAITMTDGTRPFDPHRTDAPSFVDDTIEAILAGRNHP